MSVSGRRMLDVQNDAGPHFFISLYMQYLYIDESLDKNVFVVEGILVDRENDLLLAYKQFKKQVINASMTRKQKDEVSYEFKSTLLERTYPQIKRKMLFKLNTTNCKIVYSYKNINKKVMQEDKENYYIELLSNIVKSINDDVTIITFDSFGNNRFEEKIIQSISNIENVKSISKDFSFNNKGLQFADNVCGVIRKHISNVDTNNYYEIIKNKIKTI